MRTEDAEIRTTPQIWRESPRRLELSDRVDSLNTENLPGLPDTESDLFDSINNVPALSLPRRLPRRQRTAEGSRTSLGQRDRA